MFFNFSSFVPVAITLEPAETNLFKIESPKTPVAPVKMIFKFYELH